MAQASPKRFRLSEHETNALIFRLEQRKYGHRLSSMELAQKANVSLDDVNSVEKQLPIKDQFVLDAIGHALGISGDLLRKIAGFATISAEELQIVEECFGHSPHGEEVPQQCALLGFEHIYH
ncbi:MAG: hypothetical protein EPO21_14630 [Chloroflexota bacterium]|nr:MAG: hypothetical protein EPO21_14630 [Chloroflexota bacterium]